MPIEETGADCQSAPEGGGEMNLHPDDTSQFDNARTYQHASRFIAARYSVIPVRRDRTKRSAVTWKAFQSEFARPRQLREWFDRPDPYGIAIVHGAVSGNSEVIDIDLAEIGPEFRATACREIPALARAPWIETPRPGYQLAYRNVAPPPGNLKLAERPNPEWREGLKDIPKWLTTIETRGTGGYTVTIGSPPCCHPSNRIYWLRAGSFRSVPILSTEDRERLLVIARAYDDRPAGDDRDHRNFPDRTVQPPDGDRPGDAFSRSANWDALLQPHGWRLLYTSGGVGFWKRPGKKDPGASATVNYGGYNLFYVFSSNASPFEPERGYSAFAVFALLDHCGDFSAAARELGRWGAK
jgi:Bifunctional DNA primase/polymerase, N-terminal